MGSRKTIVSGKASTHRDESRNKEAGLLEAVHINPFNARVGVILVFMKLENSTRR